MLLFSCDFKQIPKEADLQNNITYFQKCPVVKSISFRITKVEVCGIHTGAIFIKDFVVVVVLFEKRVDQGASHRIDISMIFLTPLSILRMRRHPMQNRLENIYRHVEATKPVHIVEVLPNWLRPLVKMWVRCILKCFIYQLSIFRFSHYSSWIRAIQLL